MYARNDDVNLFVDVRGRGTAIILLHGFPFEHQLWDAQITELARNHRVIAPDLRGMGRSALSSGPYLMEMLAGDVAAVLDGLAIERATIVGHSLGGYVALAFARMFVERVSALALVCSRLAADSPEQATARESLAARLETENSIEPALEAYFPKFFAARTLGENPLAIERAKTIARSIDPRGAAAMLRGMALRGDSYDIAPDLRMPVLVVAGRTDAIVPETEARAVAAAFPNAQLEWCERSAHLPMLEEPERVSDALMKFAPAGA
jgi:3-oxoadipate enol-lactonase